MAKHLNLTLGEFKKRFVAETDGVFHLIQPQDTEDCVFLEQNRCAVYEARPTQCRTWPFWPENMNSKAWKRDVIDFCPGASVKTKASLRNRDEIQKQLDEQIIAEKEIF